MWLSSIWSSQHHLKCQSCWLEYPEMSANVAYLDVEVVSQAWRKHSVQLNIGSHACLRPMQIITISWDRLVGNGIRTTNPPIRDGSFVTSAHHGDCVERPRRACKSQKIGAVHYRNFLDQPEKSYCVQSGEIGGANVRSYVWGKVGDNCVLTPIARQEPNLLWSLVFSFA